MTPLLGTNAHVHVPLDSTATDDKTDVVATGGSWYVLLPSDAVPSYPFVGVFQKVLTRCNATMLLNVPPILTIHPARAP